MLKSRLKSNVEDAVEDFQDEAVRVKDSIKNEASRVRDEAVRMKDDAVNGAADMAESVSSRLKAAGVDADAMMSAAKDKTTELQRLLADELQARPLRALGIAAAVGLIVGLISTR